MGKLTIAYLGNHRTKCEPKDRFTTECHVATSLEELGHRVIRLDEPFVTLPEIINASRESDLMLWTRTMGFLKCNGYEMLARVKCPTAAFHLDLYFGLDREDTISYDPYWKTKYVFTADGHPAHQEKFKAAGVNHFPLNPGVLRRECYIAPAREDLKCDVGFVGSCGYHKEHYRTRLIEWLRETYGPRFRLFGASGDSWRGHDLNQLYASIRVAVGDSCNLNGKLTHYVSDRLPESLGRGACTAFPRIAGVTDTFNSGRELMLYDFGDFEGLKNTINHMLLFTDKQRMDMREAAVKKILSGGWTYTARLHDLLMEVARHESAIAERLNS